jgi:hypothetical protein
MQTVEARHVGFMAAVYQHEIFLRESASRLPRPCGKSRKLLTKQTTSGRRAEVQFALTQIKFGRIKSNPSSIAPDPCLQQRSSARPKALTHPSVRLRGVLLIE